MTTTEKLRDWVRDDMWSPLVLWLVVVILASGGLLAFVLTLSSSTSADIQRFKEQCTSIGGLPIIYNDRTDQCIDDSGIVMFVRGNE